MSGVEVEYLLESQESCLRSMVEKNEKKQAERMKIHADEFEYMIKKLCGVLKEHHEIFVEQVKTIKESLDLKMMDLKAEMAKEVEKLEKSHFVLHGKVDIVADVIVKLVEYNYDYSTKLDVKTTSDSKVFEKLEEVLSSIKESVSQFALSNQSFVSQEAITQMTGTRFIS